MKNRLRRSLLVMSLAWLCSCDHSQFNDRWIQYTVQNGASFDLTIDVYQTLDGRLVRSIGLPIGENYSKDSLIVFSENDFPVENFYGGDSIRIRFADGKTLALPCQFADPTCETRSLMTGFEDRRVEGPQVDSIFSLNIIDQEEYELAE